MARPAKPWWREDRGYWCAKIRGRKVNLGTDYDAALVRLYQLKGLAEQAVPLATGSPVAEILQRYLLWVKANRSERTFDIYRLAAKSFTAVVDASMPAVLLRPYHLTQWLAANPHWSSTTAGNYLTTIKGAYTWAVRQGFIDSSPIVTAERPPRQRRDVALTVVEVDALMAAVPEGEPFRDVLRFLVGTGCRPQELCRAEVRHYDRGRGLWMFPAAESKGKKKPRIVILTPDLQSRCDELVGERTAGPIFLNARGRAWTKDSIRHRFMRIKKRTGIALHAYALRHTYATNALERGADSVTLAELMGHADTSMLSRNYAHVYRRIDHLRRVAEQAAGRPAGTVPPAAPATPTGRGPAAGPASRPKRGRRPDAPAKSG